MYYQFNSSLLSEKHYSLVQHLLDCKNFEQSDRLLGFSKGRGTTWFLNTEQEFGINCIKRHYFRGGLFGKIIKDTYFFQNIAKTRAAQEFELLIKMSEWHLPVPRPIAYKITRITCFYQADILIEKIENTQDLSHYLQTHSLTEKEYRDIGQCIRQLHDHQIYHSDLNIHNILREKEHGKFWLIDFDKCAIREGSSWKIQNLERLLRSFHKEKERLAIHFDTTHWQWLLAGYHNAS